MAGMTRSLPPSPARAAPLRILAAALLLAAPSLPAARERSGWPGRILLDGQPTEIRWTDGDSFHVDSGPLKGFGTRLKGYNTLEAFGPVHRIGRLDPEALYTLALAAAPLLAATEWRCHSVGKPDGYGRALIDCPDAAAMLVRTGHAMVYGIDEPPDPSLLALQREAQAARAGIWAGGVPPEIFTSLHSAGEKGLKGKAPYDRLAETRTGRTRVRTHARTYATCEEVCVGEGEARSCMRYVPFERRYRDRPACLGEKRSR
jgi:endonuclease YncB( thermonuclease family)